MSALAEPTISYVELAPLIDSQQHGIDSVNSECICTTIESADIFPDFNVIDIAPGFESAIRDLMIDSIDTMLVIESIDLKPFNGVI